MDMSDESQGDSLHFLDYWRVVHSRKEIVLAVTVLIVVTGVAYTLMQPRIYKSEARIQVRDDSLSVPLFDQAMSMPTYNPFFLRTQYEVIQSKPLLYDVIEKQDLRNVWGKEYNKGVSIERTDALVELKKSLKVEQYRDTSLISIQVFRENPKEAAAIANELAYVYKEYRIDLKHEETRRGIDALKNELDKQKEIVNRAENEVEGIRKDLGISMIGDDVITEKIPLTKLETQKTEVQVEMQAALTRLREVEALDTNKLINVLSYLVNDTTLRTLRNDLIQTEVNLKLMLQDYGENHPEVMRLKVGREEIRCKLNDVVVGLMESMRIEYTTISNKYQELQTTVEAIKQEDINITSEKLLPLNKAQRELKVQRSILNALQARLIEEGMIQELPRIPVTVVDPAEASTLDRPVSPNFYLNIFIAVILGLSSGVGLAFFIEYLDTSIKTITDVERHLGLPVIGVIPQKVGPMINEGPDSPHAEAYRVLRTNIQFSIKDKNPDGAILAVVSGGVGEGKSTTVTNLAYVFAQMGQRTLIVDSDMRRPVQHSIVGISNRLGLTNLLMRDVPIEETIKPTKIENLHILPSGRLPRASMGILSSDRMKDLIATLRSRYDYVFFDTPPLVGISDASILASEMDGVLLVVQYRKYPRMISARAKQIVDNVGGNLIGVVLNNINIMRDDYYYYYHSYYSNYYYHHADDKNAQDSNTQQPA